jgi:multidrug efflux pump subunit AcrB
MKRFIAVFIRNTVLVNVLMLMILLTGFISYKFMVKEMFPEISVDMFSVSILYPGADPQEVEEGISRKIEEAVDGLEGIKRYRTVSSENMGTGIIEIKGGYPLDEAYTNIRNAIDSISTFPPDTEKPIISEALIKRQIIQVALWGNQDERVLKEFAENLKDDIQDLPSVSQVNISGAREYEIAIEVSESKLRNLGLSLQDVSNAVRQGSMNLSGGTVRTEGEEIRLRTVGRKYRGDEFDDIVVVARANGDIIRLGEVAEIKDGFTEDEIISRFNGESAVILGIFKTPSEDTLKIVGDLRALIAKKETEFPEGLNVTLWGDYSEFVSARLNLLIRNGLFGLALVFLSLWLFMEIRLSFWVTMGIPISLSGGLFIMWMVGATLNTMSLFALIMVLGIVVDDAIIIGEAIYVHRRNGDKPMLAAVNGVMEVGMPVLAAVTTSIIAFLPLMFVEGVMGKFVGIIPVAVIAALSMSLIESIFILPAHLNHLPDMKDNPDEVKSRPRRIRVRINRLIDFVIFKLYKPFIGRALHFRYISISIAVAVLLGTMGLVLGGFVKFVIFPDSDSNDIMAQLEFPNGTPLKNTTDALEQTEAALIRLIDRLEEESGHKILTNVHVVAGQNGGDEFERSGGNHVGYVRGEIVDTVERTITANEIMVLWEKETGKIPGTISQTFAGLSMGPPGSPIMIALRGEDQEELLAVSAELQDILAQYEGVYQIQDTFRPGKNEMRLDIKPEARTMGLTLEDLARQVYSGYYGSEALRIQRGRDDIRVKIRYTADERSQMAELAKMRIRTPQGHEVPFFSVANVHYDEGYANIVRLDGKKNIHVTAEVDSALANPTNVLRDIGEKHMPGIEEKYSNFVWFFDGPQTDAREAFNGLLIAFPIAMLAMYMVIASIFRSYVQPFVILMTIPFGIVGAIYGHLVMGIPLAMFSIFGMVALTGVVVNDAIVLIEAINSLLAKGVPVFDAIVQGGIRRFRAILLTTISTVGGLTPLIMEKDAQAEFIMPMAISIAAGVLFATVLTLVFIPCLMGVLNDLRRVRYALWNGVMPTREEVEPARLRNLDPLMEDAHGHEPIMAK